MNHWTGEQAAVSHRVSLTHIEQSTPDGMNLDWLQDFCEMARANGVSGSAKPEVQLTMRGKIRAIRVGIPASEPAPLPPTDS